MICRRQTPRWLALLGPILLCGCSAPATTANQTTGISPISEIKAPGTLVLLVDGHPRDIVYFINGNRIEPDEEIEWWNDARLEVELLAGFYKVEAEFRARGFAKDKTVYRITTDEPVAVNAGRVTRLIARLEKDFRGVPVLQTSLFEEAPEETTPSDNDKSSRTSGSWGADAGAAEALSGSTPPGDPAADTPPDEIVLRGGASGDSALRIDAADPTTDPSGSGGTIVIHGTDTGTQSGTTSNADLEPIGTLPETVVPYEEDLPPRSSDEIPVVDALGLDSDDAPLGPPHLTVSIRSEPSGATVLLDGHEMGSTPIRVRLNPLVDHVLQFSKDGCDHVQLLSAAGWERGRSSNIAAQLQCP